MEEKKKKVKRPLGVARLIPAKCIACGARCQADCRADAITMNEAGEPVFDIEKCTGCRRCLRVCPAEAIEIYFTPEQQKILDELAKEKGAEAEPEVEEMDEEDARIRAKLAEYKGVWIFVEQVDGEPHTVSWELLGVGADLAKTLDVELCTIVIGDNVETLCQESFAYGASKVYLMDQLVFHHYRTEPYFKAICHLVDKYKPEIVLIGATGLGRDLAGAVATELRTGLTADCTGLTIDENRFLLQTRPAFGGNVMATIMTERTRPQMASVRPHVMPMPERDDSRSGEIIRELLDIKEEDIGVKVLEVHDSRSHAAEDVDIAAADIVVAGGRGMQSMENFRLLQELADELGGVVAGSRSAVEAGWIPVERQVGQTGKTIRPKIYIACGISGAIQHLVGMQDSDVIIAINRDRTAPIFEVATYGIEGDVFQVVPAITARIQELRAREKD
ncbi:MAG TPA: 4Fe-4S dicluster domain-containing protein [Dehalococcoidia bacterium]|nr:4Fe-4S dicluster domain-containing protein [Dehalococcoidia bacterium]